MKKYSVVLVVVLLFVASVGSAFAANDLREGAGAISVGMGDSIFSNNVMPGMTTYINNVADINGRYLVQRDVALYGGVGFQSDGSDANAGYFSIKAGARKYLKVDDLAPFIEGQLGFATVSVQGEHTLSVVDLAALFGAEYFLGKQFSLEGAVGFGVGQAKQTTGAKDGATDNYFGTRTVGVHANFYF